MRSRTISTAVLALTVLALGVSACTAGASSGLESGERTIYMAAVEPKGGVTTDKEPFPAQALPTGGGYVLSAPNDDGRWEVSTYKWEPGTVVVAEGDVVTLEILGVNGAEHPFRIDGYDVSGVVKRGELTTVTFTADKPGIFRILCEVHLPSMQGTLVVLSAA